MSHRHPRVTSNWNEAMLASHMALPATKGVRVFTTSGSARILVTVSTSEQHPVFCLSADRLLAWCCLDSERCTTNKGQINVCISKFNSPYVTVADEYQALGIKSIPANLSAGAVIVSGSATFFSSTLVATGGSTSSPHTSETSPARTPSSTNSGGQHSTPSPHPSPSPDLGPGAIAGIVVGSLVAIGLIVGAVWLFRSKKQRGKNLGSVTAPPSTPATESRRDRKEAPESALYEANGRQVPPELSEEAMSHELEGDHRQKL